MVLYRRDVRNAVDQRDPGHAELPPTLPALTSMRFFAAIAVVLYHYADRPVASHLWMLRNLIDQGFLGVGFFYVLSGFVLVHAYSKATVEPQTFWRRRAGRILPAYWLAFGLGAPRVIAHHLQASGALVGGSKIAISATVNLLLLEAWLPFASSAWNSPAWSVSVEAFFYAVFPWLLPRVARLSARDSAVAFGLSWLAGLTVPSVVLLLSRTGAVASVQVVNPTLPLLHLPAFVCGMCARQILADPSVREWLHGRATLRWVIPVVLLCLCVDSSPLAPLPALNLHVPIWAALFVATSTRAKRRSLLEARPLLVLGEASYALYILQEPIKVLFTGLVGPTTSPSLLCAYLALLVAISVAVWRYLELPAKRWFERAARQFALAR